MKVNGFEVDVKVINNYKKYTLFSVHGMNSTMNFIASLDKGPKNFNHIKITLPQKGNITLEQMNEVVGSIIDNNIESDHIVLLGHSLGGVQVASNAMNVKVRKVVYVSPVNPSFITTSKRMLLQTTFGPGKVSSIVKKWFQAHGEKEELLSPVLDPNRPYRATFVDYLMTPAYMKKLDTLYKENTKPSLYIIGNLDVFVDPKAFEKYLKTFGKKPHIVKGGHNPFWYDPSTVRNLLNDFIPDENQETKHEIWKDS